MKFVRHAHERRRLFTLFQLRPDAFNPALDVGYAMQNRTPNGCNGAHAAAGQLKHAGQLRTE